MLFATSLGNYIKSTVGRLLNLHKPHQYNHICSMYPRAVFMEVTNYCNLNCVMCTFHSKESPFRGNGRFSRSKGFMSESLAYKIIDELGSSDVPIWLAMHGAGEPLLHPKIEMFIRRASKYDNLNVGFLTNGMLLTDEKIKALLDSGIKWLSVSIDGLRADLMEKYRKGASFSKIHSNTMHLIQAVTSREEKPFLHVNMTVQKEMEADVDQFVDYWLQYVDQVSVSPCRPIGSRKSPLLPEGVRREPCYMLFETMVIFWDGSVGLCCEDWFNWGQMGSVELNSLYEVWHGKKFSKVRELHLKGKYSKLMLCKECDIWFNKTPKVYFDTNRNCEVVVNAWQTIYRKVNKAKSETIRLADAL